MTGNRTGIRMDVLDRVIEDLNACRELQELFGVPVSRGLCLIADGNDLRIEDNGRVSLTAQQQQTFLGVLERILQTHVTSHNYLSESTEETT